MKVILQNIPEATCNCYTPPVYYGDYQINYLGTDNTNGRFAEVTIETCIMCKTNWLKYLVEVEGLSNSGRWYRGIIAGIDVNEMTPEKALAYLEKLNWYMYGGSYFHSSGSYGSGKISD